VLLEKVVNQILEVEITKRLGAERTDERRGYRSWSHERTWITGIGRFKLEVPRSREATARTDPVERYQRSDKALVTTLMQLVLQGVSTRRVKKPATEL